MGKVLKLAVLALLGASAPALAQDDGERSPEVSAARSPVLPPAEFDEALAIGGEQIDARKLRSRMTVDVLINGKGPYKFVVDSGADTSVIGEGLAGRLALEPGTPTLLHGVTESAIVDRVMVDELQLGPTISTALELPVLEERDLGGDGMVGLDALVEQRLMMDFEKRLITVDDGRVPEPLRDGVIVVTGRLQRGQLILTKVKAGKHRVDAVVDTGSEITIGNIALRDKLLRRGKTDFQKITVYGVTGAAIDLDFAFIKELKLGPIKLTNVPIAFADIPPFEVFGIDKEPSLLLGTDLMENFRRVSLDFHDRKVRFQLRKCEARLVVRTVTSASRLRAEERSACQE
ncbi:retroviral-like aspartic protease family protein [Erythrobacter mangrovi]|uniref:Aspartyl protease family protein n=1 Tax=Erythrobacter mangrovi TaxID=2739433 RepID=A0A7D3XSV1_9SPHN|nr:retroviral-like aspartic protease family protein [Erythrobacter mangrovi]QKG72091.1 aspartyl protease family protein [Erythrobacter mangrovi]